MSDCCSPHAPPLHGSLPPRGLGLPWGRPGGWPVRCSEVTPELRRCTGRCRPGGLGLPWGRPGGWPVRCSESFHVRQRTVGN